MESGDTFDRLSFSYKGGKFLKKLRNCGATWAGVLQDNLVLSTELIM